MMQDEIQDNEIITNQISIKLSVMECFQGDFHKK